MRVVRAYSYKCANGLAKQLNEGNEKKRIYFYSFQIIIGGFVKIALLTLIALLLGCLTETYMVITFYSALRIVGGGYHMDDYTNCMLTSFAIFIGFGFITKYTYTYWSTIALLVLSVVAFASALYIVARYAPADTHFKPMNNIKQNMKLKKIAVFIVFIWIVLNASFLIKGYKLPVLAGCLGMLTSSFIISPAGYSFFDFISGRMKRIRRYPSAR